MNKQQEKRLCQLRRLRICADEPMTKIQIKQLIKLQRLKIACLESDGHCNALLNAVDMLAVYEIEFQKCS